MNTKILMIASSVFLGAIGIGLTFLNEEIAEVLSVDTGKISLLILQVLGSVYLGFAMLNWMTKNNLIGGIYSRPLLIGNLTHFLVSAFALIKMVGHSENQFEIMLTLAIIYAVFSLGFGYVFMTNPNKLIK